MPPFRAGIPTRHHFPASRGRRRTSSRTPPPPARPRRPPDLATDCGPAALRSLLAGFDIHLALDDLRRLCQVGVEGSSIDVLETLARRCGLDAEQILVPTDHILLPAARCLPALAVTRLDSGAAHFVVLWRRWGPLVELMDPAAGRRWLRVTALPRHLYAHHLAVPAARWETWAHTTDFLASLAARARALGLCSRDLAPLLTELPPGWQPLAALDAALRRTAGLLRLRGPRCRRRDTRALALALHDHYRRTGPETGAGDRDPAPWSVRLAPPRTPAESCSPEPLLEVRGALLVRVLGLLPPGAGTASPCTQPGGPRRPPWQEHPLGFLAAFLPARRAALLALAAPPLAAAALLEPLLLSRVIAPAPGATGPPLAVLLCAHATCEAVLLALHGATAAGLLSLGRHLELRLRLALDHSLPSLPDAFTRTRLSSDLAHSLHRLRRFPAVAFGLLRDTCELVLYALALARLAPSRAPLVTALALLLAALPLALHSIFRHLDLQVRQRSAALAAAWLDLLRGAATVRAAAAEPALATLFHHRLTGRAQARRAQTSAQTYLEIALHLLAAGLAAALFLGRTAAFDASSAFLAAYWNPCRRRPRPAPRRRAHLPAARPSRPRRPPARAPGGGRRHRRHPRPRPGRAMPPESAATFDRNTPERVRLHQGANARTEPKPGAAARHPDSLPQSTESPDEIRRGGVAGSPVATRGSGAARRASARVPC
jgi:hypothetical protein